MLKLALPFAFLILFTTPIYSQKLFEAVEKLDLARVKELLDKGADPNEYSKNGLFPLFRAVDSENTEIASLLIQHGANVKQRTKVGPAFFSSIVGPCQDGHLEMVKLLIENGVDVDVKEFRDFTPLRIAARNGHADIVQYLVEKGATIDTRAMDGATPLEHAAAKGHTDIVKYLLEKGANPNIIDKEGDFPLGEATKNGHLEIVKLLLENGAQLNVKDAKNLTALDLAKQHGQSKAAAMIQEYLNKNGVR